MSNREYNPPQIGDSTPEDVLYMQNGRDFTNIRQRRRGETTVGRSIAIFVDGACSGNGTRWARAGLGVYFGPGSRYNISKRLWDGTQTNQRAEIHAGISALRRVRELLDCGKLATRTVVLISDSRYVVNAMTDWVYKWRDNDWANAKGREVANREDFEELDDLIDDLEEDYGVYVRLWHVDREDNQEADELAKEALKSD